MKIQPFLLYVIIFFFGISLVGCNQTNIKADNKPVIDNLDSYQIVLDTNDIVPLSGFLDYDKYQNQAGNGIVYHGGDAVTLFAQLLTHALVSSAVDSSIEKKFVTLSNKFLDQYTSVTDQFTIKDMTQGFISELQSDTNSYPIALVSDVGENQIPKGYLVLKPKLILTEGLDTLILENSISLHTHKKKKRKKSKSRKKIFSKFSEPIFSNTFIVADLSNGFTKEDILDDDGTKFRLRAKNLFQQSMELFASRYPKPIQENHKHETIRYALSGVSRVERGFVIHRECERIVFKSLKGHIKSVPTISSCKP